MLDFFKKKRRKCPYCGIQIDKEPKGKFKCPSCKEEIYPEKKEGKLIMYNTKKDYETLQLKKKEQAAKNKFFRFFESFEISKGYLDQRRADWIRRTNLTLNYDDLIWTLSNEMLLEYAKHNKFQEMSSLYFSMAYFQKERNNEFFHLLQESRKIELYNTKKQLIGLKYKVIIVDGELDCKACQELDGKMFSIKEALEKMPIPPKNCTHDGGWCTCCYTTELEKT